MMVVVLAVITMLYSDSSSSQQSVQLPGRQSRKCDPLHPGFHFHTSRVDKFSGKRGDDDFEVWLLDLLK